MGVETSVGAVQALGAGGVLAQEAVGAGGVDGGDEITFGRATEDRLT